ncbi:uncharacterized protein LOC125211405 [Salvia hispanica]|uniref:uncharacterized protein LOC125211405 n=1 Tax=Salvia hispanica TaxID=49212 RepID=UPI00200940E6|nr:uncharacterized protein LOC125211405 [Salvia hispanica]
MVLTSTLMDQVQEMIAVSHSVRCKLFIFIEFSRNSWSALSVLVLILCCWSAPVLGFLVFYISFTDSVFRSTRNSLIRSLIRVSTVDLKLSLTWLIKMQMEELLKIKSESCCAALWLHGDRVSANNHVLHSSQIYAQALLNDNWKY